MDSQVWKAYKNCSYDLAKERREQALNINSVLRKTRDQHIKCTWAKLTRQRSRITPDPPLLPRKQNSKGNSMWATLDIHKRAKQELKTRLWTSMINPFSRWVLHRWIHSCSQPQWWRRTRMRFRVGTEKDLGRSRLACIMHFTVYLPADLSPQYIFV